MAITDNYIVYENWRAKQEPTGTIHKIGCVHARGVEPNITSSRNGKWHGIYTSLDEAKIFVTSLQNRVCHLCSFCITS